MRDARDIGEPCLRHAFAQTCIDCLALDAEKATRFGRTQAETRHDRDEIPNPSAGVDAPVRGHNRRRLEAPSAGQNLRVPDDGLHNLKYTATGVQLQPMCNPVLRKMARAAGSQADDLTRPRLRLVREGATT